MLQLFFPFSHKEVNFIIGWPELKIKSPIITDLSRHYCRYIIYKHSCQTPRPQKKFVRIVLKLFLFYLSQHRRCCGRLHNYYYCYLCCRYFNSNSSNNSSYANNNKNNNRSTGRYNEDDNNNNNDNMKKVLKLLTHAPVFASVITDMY